MVSIFFCVPALPKYDKSIDSSNCFSQNVSTNTIKEQSQKKLLHWARLTGTGTLDWEGLYLQITVDYREKSSGMVELLSEYYAVEVATLPYGDYLINDRLTVERKTARDFLISIIDLRLFNQVANLKKNCSHPFLLIEGNPYATDLDFDPRAIRGALLSVQTGWQVPVIFSRSKEDSVDVMVTVGRQDEVTTDGVILRGGYRPKKLKTRQLYLLQGLPDVGPKLAKRLLNHFHSVGQIMSATVDELMEVEGVGKCRAGKIREVLD